ncbi:DUF4158 domain-containing protein [Nonomuraea fuscirosea]
MSEKMFFEEQLEQLRSSPEIAGDELIRYFTPAAADVAFVDPGKGRGSIDQLGMLVQLCTLPWLGFVPDDVAAAPAAVVARVAERLGVAPAALRLYGKRDQTRSDHLGLVANYLEWQTAPAGSRAMKELEQFLLDRAMEHDSPTLLFNLAREYLMAAKVIRPGVLILAKMVGTARKAASDLTSQLVGHLLTAEVRADLERMLVVDAGLGMTRLEWLVSPARDASATSVKTAIDKLSWLRAIDAHQGAGPAVGGEARRTRRERVAGMAAGRLPGHAGPHRPARAAAGSARLDRVPGRLRAPGRHLHPHERSAEIAGGAADQRGLQRRIDSGDQGRG